MTPLRAGTAGHWASAKRENLVQITLAGQAAVPGAKTATPRPRLICLVSQVKSATSALRNAVRFVQTPGTKLCALAAGFFLHGKSGGDFRAAGQRVKRGPDADPVVEVRGRHFAAGQFGKQPHRPSASRVGRQFCRLLSTSRPLRRASVLPVCKQRTGRTRSHRLAVGSADADQPLVIAERPPSCV